MENHCLDAYNYFLEDMMIKPASKNETCHYSSFLPYRNWTGSKSRRLQEWAIIHIKEGGKVLYAAYRTEDAEIFLKELAEWGL